MMASDVPDGWGSYGKEPPCEHLLELRHLMVRLGLCVYSEHGEPDLWVNVHCKHCRRTYEVSFRDDFRGGS